MKKLFMLAIIIAVATAPASLRAQSTRPQPSAAAGKKTVAAKSARKQILFPHPNAAQRHVTPSDLVLVTTSSGEKKYARKKTVKTIR